MSDAVQSFLSRFDQLERESFYRVARAYPKSCDAVLRFMEHCQADAVNIDDITENVASLFLGAGLGDNGLTLAEEAAFAIRAYRLTLSDLQSVALGATVIEAMRRGEARRSCKTPVGCELRVIYGGGNA